MGNRGCKSFQNLGKILEHVIKWMTYDCLKLVVVPIGFSQMLTASQINVCTRKTEYFSYMSSLLLIQNTLPLTPNARAFSPTKQFSGIPAGCPTI